MIGTAWAQAPTELSDEQHQLTGTSNKYRPLAHMRLAGLKIEVPISATLSARNASPVQVDPTGTEFAPDTALDTQIRAGLIIDTEMRYAPIIFKAELEADLFSGIIDGGSDPDDPRFDNAPWGKETESLTLRKAYGRLSVGPFLTFGGGYMTSHWGLGLLANDGAHGWTPGSAYFSDPRGGDRVLRGFLATGPWTSAKLAFSVAYDVVQHDDIIGQTDDEASQIIGSIVLGKGKPSNAGIYAVHRTQTTADDKTTEVTALDFYGRWTKKLNDKVRYTAELETALISGTTELGPTTDYQEHDVLQLGAAGRLGIDAGDFGMVFDTTWTTGDQNFDDDSQNAFKADPNFDQGLIAFKHVIAAQSARAPITAADPDLVGRPAEDLNRLPTQGSVSNAVTFFPRVWVRPAHGLEIYGGPLFMFAEVEPADPRNSRLGGGTPRTALDGLPGDYLGTEFDLGLRYTTLLHGTELMLGLEGGVFQPGDAMNTLGGTPLGASHGGRAIVRFRL
jgi:hypothetical protein